MFVLVKIADHKEDETIGAHEASFWYQFSALQNTSSEAKREVLIRYRINYAVEIPQELL